MDAEFCIRILKEAMTKQGRQSSLDRQPHDQAVLVISSARMRSRACHREGLRNEGNYPQMVGLL